MSAKRLNGNERRDQIVSATATVFAHRGFRAASTAELADAAGISDGLIFRYFPTKAELYEAVLDRAIATLEASLREHVDPAATPAEQFEQSVRTTAAFAATDHDAWKNLTSAGGDEWLMQRQLSMHRRAIDSVSRLLDSDARARNQRVAPKQLERYAVLAAGAGIALVNTCMTGIDMEPIFAFFTGGILGGFSGPPE